MTTPVHPAGERPWAIFLIFLRLGLTAFGGPVAHLVYFRDEFVARRCWLSESAYADLVALCQFLPGPASSQVGMALGMARAGFRGALAAWAGFTLPSALLMIVFALGISRFDPAAATGALHGLKLVALAVVLLAVVAMARSLCPDVRRVALMSAAAGMALWVAGAVAQIGIIVVAGVVGTAVCRATANGPGEPLPMPVGRRTGIVWLILFALLLALLPLAVRAFPSPALAMTDAFFRAGALVFGGGHVVLPLLHAEMVPTGRIAEATFLAGYGAAQALPGPLFSFAAFLGAATATPPSGWAGGMLALLAIFAPGFLLVAGALPFWERLRRNPRAQSALAGINAGVVGLLLAALAQMTAAALPFRPVDVAIAGCALAALAIVRLPPWLVVAGGALAGWLAGL